MLGLNFFYLKSKRVDLLLEICNPENLSKDLKSQDRTFKLQIWRSVRNAKSAQYPAACPSFLDSEAPI